MLDAAQASSLNPVSLLDPEVITATTTSPSGYWADQTPNEGYIDYILSLGTVTATSVTVTLESSASTTGSSADSSQTATATFGAILAAATPVQKVLTLPANFFVNRYVGAVATVAGTGNVPISLIAVGGKRTP